MLSVRDLTGNEEPFTHFRGLRRSRKINGERSISFTVLPTETNKHAFDLIEEESTIYAFDDEYIIKKVNSEAIGNTYVKKVEAIHKFYVDLINKQQPKIHNGSITFRNYMNLVFEDTPYANFEIEDHFSAREFENLGNDNRLALLQKGLDRFKAEMAILPISYKPIFKINVGENTDFQFRFGHNIKAISVDVDTTNLATKISGTGDPELDIKASYTSPNASIFGIIDAPPVNDERFKSESTLLEEMKSRLIDTPEMSMTIDFVDLRAAGYPYDAPNEGDRVFVIYEPMNDLLLETRILEINEEFDVNLNPIKTEVTLSNKKKTFAGTMFDNVQKQISDSEANQNKKIQRAIESADGKNTNYYGPDEPNVDAKKGDLWFKVVDGVYTRTYRYDGSDWVIINDMADKENEELANAAKDRANEAYDRASRGIEDAQEAFDKAQDNATLLNDFGLRMEDAEDNITTIAGTVQGLQTQVADNTGNISTVTQLANTLQSELSSLEDDVSSTFTQLSDAINLRVKTDDLINQINIDTSGVLISGKKLILDGDTTVNGSFKVSDANIINLDAGKITFGTLDGARASIININASNINTGELNANFVTVFGGNSTDYTSIEGSTIELRGRYRRTWQGKTTTHDVKTRLHNGHLRFRNDILERSLYMSEFGISTYVDGEGESGGSSGTILWWDKTYTPGGSRGITIHSHPGAVALATNTSHVVIDSYQSAQILSKNSGVMINPYDDETQRYFWFTKSTDFRDGYLLFGDENRTGLRFDRGSFGLIQVVDSDNKTGGNTEIESGYGTFNTIRRRSGTNYLNLQNSNYMMIGLDISGNARIASNVIYRRTYSSGANVHITGEDTLGRSTSARKYKRDIEPITKEYAYNFFDNAVPIYYRPFNTDDENMDHSHYGYIADDIVPIEPRLVQFRNGEPESFNYDRVPTLLHVVLKNEVKRIDEHEDRINILELENQYLKQKIKQLEESA